MDGLVSENTHIANRFDYGMAEIEPFEAMPTSVDLLFVSNPLLTDPDVIASLTPEALHAAQQAFNVFHAPSNFLTQYQTGTVPKIRHFPAHSTFYHTEGFKTFVLGFKTLRRLAGEETYQGIELHLPSDEYSSLREYFPLREYLEIASRGGLAFSELGHDPDLHAMGAMLATGDIAKVVRTGARAALRLPKDEQVKIGDRIDYITYAIQTIWFAPDDIDETMDNLALALNAICESTNISYCDREDILFFVNDQVAIIRDLRKAPLFVDPRFLPMSSTEQRSQPIPPLQRGKI